VSASDPAARSRARFLAALGGSAAAVAFPSPSRAQTRKPLTAGYVPSTLFAPLFVAAERGYLHDAGFDATLQPIVAGADSMSLLAQGQIDLAGAALSAAFYNAVNRDLEVRYVASTAYQPRTGHPSALLVREDLYAAGVRIADLKGKKIGWIGNTGAASAYYVARILRPSGLRLTDIEAVNVANPDQEVALERRAVDAVFTSSPFTELFEQKNLAHVVGSPPAGIAASGIFFGSTLLAHPDAAAAVMNALRRAAAELVGDGYYSAANLAASAKYTRQPVALLRTAPRYDLTPDLRIDQATLEDMQHEFIEDGILTYKAPLSGMRLAARF
jgi:NitT/TauT family transport system substrate-binding protein